MKRILFFSVAIILFVRCESSSTKISIKGLNKLVLTSDLQPGDIIFQSSTSGQGLAIQLATHSKYSHVGILFEKDGKLVVYEAVQPVRISELDEWIERGDEHHFVVKRLKNSDKILTPSLITQMQAEATKHLDKNYDAYFGWSDDRIYCSELVWKIYHRTTGLKIGTLQALKSFDLSAPIVQETMHRRYGKNIPYEEPVISPGAMFDDPLLYTVTKR